MINFRGKIRPFDLMSRYKKLAGGEKETRLTMEVPDIA